MQKVQVTTATATTTRSSTRQWLCLSLALACGGGSTGSWVESFSLLQRQPYKTPLPSSIPLFTSSFKTHGSRSSPWALFQASSSSNTPYTNATRDDEKILHAESSSSQRQQQQHAVRKSAVGNVLNNNGLLMNHTEVTRQSLERQFSSSSSSSKPVVVNGLGKSKNSNKDESNGRNVLQEEPTRTDSKLFTWTNQWYPVMPISYLEGLDPQKPLSIKVMDRELVVWRSGISSSSDNKAGCEWSILQDVCPHRRAPLSTGKVVTATAADGSMTKHLQCRFHGWEFETAGTVAKIPMLTANSPLPKCGTKSYASKTVGGLLWVFIDDPNDEQKKDTGKSIFSRDATTATTSLLPDIPAGSILSKSENMIWSLVDVPVSLTSMLENSFDPSHAPFIHEGIKDFGSGSTFSPHMAMPIQRYELLRQDETGFVVQHTPYSLLAKNATELTTRQYIAPSTQLTTNNHWSFFLYFIPVAARETRVLLALPGPPAKFKRWMPRFLSNAVADMLHFSLVASKSNRRFNLQDNNTMRKQDEYKLGTSDKIVLDMTPTPADFGVRTFQQWIRTRTATGHGPFLAGAAPAATAETKTTNSLWDTHAKYCPRCQRVLKRAAKMEAISNKISSLALASAVASFLHSVLWKRAATVVAAGSAAVHTWTVALLVVSACSKWFAQKNAGIHLAVHSKLDHDIDEIFAYDKKPSK